MAKTTPAHHHIDRLPDNIARVHHLVSIYKSLAGPQSGRRSVPVTDVLRAAVVLLHASLEDFLRSLARTHLPQAGPEVINAIPLKRVGRPGRAEKFALGDLDEHRGKTVDDLIAESVDAYLDRSNYNNSTDVVQLLENLDLNPEPVRQFLPEIDKMMQRRHQIVHRADCTETTGRGHHKAQALRAATVERWIDAVVEFHVKAVQQIQQKESNGE